MAINELDKSIERAEIHVKSHGGLVWKDPKTGYFVPGNLAGKMPQKQAIYSQKVLLHYFQAVFDQPDDETGIARGVKYLNEMMERKPDKFFDIWSRLLLKSLPDQSPNDTATGQGLLNALQTGRLAEQLASLVTAGQKALEKQQGETDKVPVEPAPIDQDTGP